MAVSAAGPRAVRLYLHRHGTSEWNLLTKWQGETDIKLAPEGKAQAEDAAAAHMAAAVRFDAARCSDLARAAHTADILFAACAPSGTDSTVVRDPRLRECSLGVFEGLTRAEIKGEGSQYRPIFDQLQTLDHEERLDTAYFEGLETPRQLGTRAMECVVELARELRSSDGGRSGDDSSNGGGGGDCATGLIVTHSTVLESILATFFNKSYDSVHTQTLACVVLRLEVGAAEDAFTIEEMRGIECEEAP